MAARVLFACAMPAVMIAVTSAAVIAVAVVRRDQPALGHGGTGLEEDVVAGVRHPVRAGADGRVEPVVRVAAADRVAHLRARASAPSTEPPGPNTSSWMPTRSMRPTGSREPGRQGTPPRSPTGAVGAPPTDARAPPTAANAIHSASSDRSGWAGL